MLKKIILLVVLIFQISVFSQNYKFGKVSKEELQEDFYPSDSTADAAYLYKYRNTFYTYNNTSGWFDVITEVHHRIKIYTKEGFNKATLGIKYVKPDSGSDEKISSIKGYTFNIDGNKVTKEKLSKEDVFDEKINKYRSVKKITMPNIKEGSVIDLKYKLISPYYTYIDDLEFQHGIPVKHLDFTIGIPEYYKFNIATKGYYYIEPVKTVSSSNFSYKAKYKQGVGADRTTSYENINVEFETNRSQYKATNIPALKDDEPFVFNINNHRGGIKYELSSIDFPERATKYYSTTWEDVSKQIFKSESFGSEINKSTYYKNDLNNILSNTINDVQKVAAIFSFVKSKVKWNGYYNKYIDKGVRKAYKEGSGNAADINLMLTSMMRSAGLDANPVLVSTKANGVPLFPTLDGFNYVVSMVEFTDGKYMLLDATEPYSIPNILPSRAVNWNGRKVTKKGNSSWVKLAPTKFGEENNNVMVKITDDLMVEGLIRTKYSNLKALDFRIKNNHIKEEDIISNLENRYSIEIENYKLTNARKITKPISRTIKFNSEDLIESINNKIYIDPLLFFAQKTIPFKADDRKFPVEFDSPFKLKNTVAINIPEGYTIEKLPEPLAVSLPEDLGVFKYQVIQRGSKISTLSVLQFNKATIAPQYYATLKEFYSQIVKKQSEKIVLIKE